MRSNFGILVAGVSTLLIGLSVQAQSNAGKNQDPSNVSTQPRTGTPAKDIKDRDGTATSTNATSESDTEITRKIRQSLVSKDISTAAKNVTISTNGGKVIISGNVDSPAERTTVIDSATAVAGRGNVKNELHVTR